MTRMLLRNPGSWLYAAVAGWEFPASRDWILTADLYDLTHQAHWKKKVKPYPRPQSGRNRISNSAGRTRQEVLAILRPGQEA